eukprot:SAG11_NODE_1396_length_5036_cov_2.382824_3_plen_307_part_00
MQQQQAAHEASRSVDEVAALQLRARRATAKSDELGALAGQYKATAEALVVELKARREEGAARITMRRELRRTGGGSANSAIPRCRPLVEQRTRLRAEVRRLRRSVAAQHKAQTQAQAQQVRHLYQAGAEATVAAGATVPPRTPARGSQSDLEVATPPWRPGGGSGMVPRHSSAVGSASGRRSREKHQRREGGQAQGEHKSPRPSPSKQRRDPRGGDGGDGRGIGGGGGGSRQNPDRPSKEAAAAAVGGADFMGRYEEDLRERQARRQAKLRAHEAAELVRDRCEGGTAFDDSFGTQALLHSSSDLI